MQNATQYNQLIIKYDSTWLQEEYTFINYKFTIQALT